MNKVFRGNINLSQKLKSIIIERASLCIQFEIGTKTVMFLKLKKISQSSEQTIIDLTEWRELESKRIREFRKELARSKSILRKKYGISNDDEDVDMGCGNKFHLLTSEHLQQMTVFKKLIEFDVFYRDPKKCLSPLTNSQHDWQKIETIRDRKYKKEKLKVRQENLALFRRKHSVAREGESDNELEN